MGVEAVEPGDEQAVKAACHHVLWDMRPVDTDETQSLLAELERHVRALGPRVAALVPHLTGETRETALVVMRNVDTVFDPDVSYPDAPPAEAQAQLHDLAIVARALSSIALLAERWDRERVEQPADGGDGPTDAASWLVARVGS
ncbi:hypothetical protein [Streptomyces sp. NPDC052721]|uniref:hypothetical protein n=1 Tax=Streptomyces sp. NPDC052721 TaxID=3154955 RepID=UPI0034405512